jgi:hypothetical protein
MIVQHNCNYQVFMNTSPTNVHTYQFNTAYDCYKERLRKVVFVRPFSTRWLPIAMACKQRKLYSSRVQHTQFNSHPNITQLPSANTHTGGKIMIA